MARQTRPYVTAAQEIARVESGPRNPARATGSIRRKEPRPRIPASALNPCSCAGLKLSPPGSHLQVQLSGVDAFFGQVVADIDDAHFGKITHEELSDPHPRFWIEDVERVLHNDPKRSMHHDAGKRQPLLLVVG